MKHLIRAAVLWGLLSLAGLSLAQSTAQAGRYNGGTPLYKKPAGFLDALLTSNRFSMTQSYTFMIGSGGGYNYNLGLYLNTMNLRLADPLFAQVRIGYLHQPFSSFGSQTQIDGRLFLQSALLEYQPSSSMKISLEYQEIPATMFSPYYRR